MIGSRIKNRRLELGMTQDELAKLMGYKTRSTINKIELDINDMPLSRVEAFAKALGVSPSYLMGWEVNQSNNSGTISNNIGSDSSENNNTYTTNNYFSSPCAQQKEAIVNHDVSTSINSKELFFELLMAIKDMSDEQLEDMIKYAEFTVNR